MRDVQGKMYYIILHVITNATGVKLESLKLFYGKCSRRTALLWGLSERVP